MTNTVHEVYGNRLRVRACGILIENERLLMVNHSKLAVSDFWAPPGGGVDFGESAPATLVRELKEETGLDTEVGEFLFACEFIKKPLHAIELFFMIRRLGGKMKKGLDPETSRREQIIQSVRFMDWQEITALNPEARHGVFRFVEQPIQVTRLRGYFRV